MQATGNDFVVIDSSNQPALAGAKGGPGKPVTSNQKLSLLATRLCDRRFGIGADGLLLLEKSKKADFKMRVFNPDGTEPDMCGNGLQCVALFAQKNKIAPSNMSVETKAGIINAEVKKNKVKIKMAKPESIKLDLDITIDGGDYQVHCVNTGVPHVIFYVDDLEKTDVYNLGRIARFHPLFMPKGANVNFVKISDKDSIKIRTYERGVEGETLACGTGAVACAIISSILKSMNSPITVYAKGGLLKIYFKKQGNKFKDVFLEGEANIVFEGKIGV